MPLVEPSDYEQHRLDRIRRNQAMLHSLGVPEAKQNLSQVAVQKRAAARTAAVLPRLPTAHRDHALERTLTPNSTTAEERRRMATGGVWPAYVCGEFVRDESGRAVARAPTLVRERAPRTYQGKSEDVRAVFRLVCPGHPDPRTDRERFVSECCGRGARFPWVRGHAAVCSAVFESEYVQARKTHMLTSVMHLCTALGEHDLAERYGRAASASALHTRTGADVPACGAHRYGQFVSEVMKPAVARPDVCAAAAAGVLEPQVVGLHVLEPQPDVDVAITEASATFGVDVATAEASALLVGLGMRVSTRTLGAGHLPRVLLLLVRTLNYFLEFSVHGMRARAAAAMTEAAGGVLDMEDAQFGALCDKFAAIPANLDEQARGQAMWDALGMRTAKSRGSAVRHGLQDLQTFFY